MAPNLRHTFGGHIIYTDMECCRALFQLRARLHQSSLVFGYQLVGETQDDLQRSTLWFGTLVLGHSRFSLLTTWLFVSTYVYIIVYIDINLTSGYSTRLVSKF